MTRYGLSLYGDGLYGADTDEILLWTFQVDWLGDGTFDPPSNTFNNEALKMVDLSVSRGRDYLIKPDGSGFEHYRPGEAVGIFDNEDGRLDPWNTSSPLYPYIKPGKFVRILVKDAPSGTNYGVMRGTITDIQPVLMGGVPHVRIVVRDGLQWLNDRTLKISIQEIVVRGTATFYILDNADWPFSEWPWTLYTSDQFNTEYNNWWVWNSSALSALHAIGDSEFAAMFHDRNGNYSVQARDLTHQRSLDVDQSVILRDIMLSQPWENVRNEIRVNSYPKFLDTSGGTKWELQDIPAIADGEALTVTAHFRYDIYSPVCGYNLSYSHVVNAQEDGLGADLTASCPLTYDTRFSSEANLTITNNSGQVGYIISLLAQGNIVYSPYTSTARAEDTDSQADYGERSFSADGFWQESTAQSQLVANWLLFNLKDAQPNPIIQFENRPTYQFYLDLYDRVVLTVDKFGIENQSFRVGKIDHRWLRKNGTSVRTTMKLEPYFTTYVEPPSDPAYYGALATVNASQSVTATVWKVLNFATQDHDTDGYHFLTDKLTIPANLGGRYYIYANVNWNAGTAGTLRAIRIVNQDGTVLAYAEGNPGNGQLHAQNLHVIVDLNSGNWLRVQGYSSENTSTWNTADTVYFGLFWLNEEA